MAQLNAGLGGIANIFNQKTAFLETGPRHEYRALKETPVPPEIVSLLEELKVHQKAEKVKFAELYKAGESGIAKVSDIADEVAINVGNLSNAIYRHSTTARELRNIYKREIAYAEMATQTKDTPSALQLGHTAPTVYFNQLISNFEIKLEIYRKEIAKAEGILISCPPNKEVSSDDLIEALDRLKEGLVKVAAKVQVVHEQVESEVITHRNLQRYVLGETSELISSTPQENPQNDYLSSTPVPIEKATILFPIRMMDYGKLSSTITSPVGISKPPYFPTPNIGSATVKPNPLLSTLTTSTSRPVFSTNYPGQSSMYGQTSFLSPPPENTSLFGGNQNLSLKRTKH